MAIHVVDFRLWGLPVVLYLIGQLFWKRRIPLPPGPPGWPLIGNLLDFPKNSPYKTWGPMSKKYGPIVTINMMGTPYVILNSPKVTKDLLEKKSAITSNRPHFTMCSDLVGWNNALVFMQYGDRYRKHHKFFRQELGTKSSLEAFYPAEEAETKQFLRNVLKNPGDLIAHAHRMAGSVILRISHGHVVKQDDDPLVMLVNEALENLVAIATPGLFLVDMFPILRYLPEWFPGGGFHKDARRWRNLLNEAVDTPYEFVLEHLAKGDAAPSFLSRLLRKGVTPEEEEILKWASFAMFLGGSDTTPASICAFFLAMTIYPDVLKKAQAEVDAVIGHDRLPTFEDRDALPYVNAICMELLRWHVVVPTGMHITTQDIVYDGYLIPKGTPAFGNIWYILSDPDTYPNPDVFDPERFLGENQQLDPREACFGWGKRSCPGANLAELTLFICVAMVVATLDVSRCVENGAELVPRYDVTETVLLRHVKPFKCRITPRSKAAEGLLRL